jgi:hypothetical protein
VFYGENQSQDRCIRPALDSPARTDQVIVASVRPWCFSARIDQMVIQVSDEFLTGVEVLLNYFVICIVAPSDSSLRGSIRVCFSSCFSSACIFQAEFI